MQPVQEGTTQLPEAVSQESTIPKIFEIAEVFHHIVKYLDPEKIVELSFVCRKFKALLSCNELLQKITWPKARKISPIPGNTIAECERKYQDVGIKHLKLLNILGGLESAYHLPKITLTSPIGQNIKSLSTQFPIVRGVDSEKKPFIIFRYVINDPFKEQTLQTIEALYQTEAANQIYWKAASKNFTPQISMGVKEITDVEVEEVVLARIKKLIDGQSVGKALLKKITHKHPTKKDPHPNIPYYESKYTDREFSLSVKLQ